jgi:hypothetical protein
MGVSQRRSMEETLTGRGTLNSLSDSNWVHEVCYEFRFSCRPADPLARVCIDVKRVVILDHREKEIPPGEYLLIERESAATHKIRHLGLYIGWSYQGVK